MVTIRGQLRPPQKGLGQLRFRTAIAEAEYASTSQRRWYWEFLRLSLPYWLAGRALYGDALATDNRQLAKLYRAFGDIHQTNFRDWWMQTGASLFQEPDDYPKVREISLSSDRDALIGKDRILVEIPYKLSRRTIQRAIGNILTKYEELRPNNRLELGRGRYRLTPNALRTHTLQKLHEIYCLHRELVLKPQRMYELATSDKEREYWSKRAAIKPDLVKFGKLLRLSPSNEPLGECDRQKAAKTNRMRATVSRYIGRAEQLIANVERGEFPVFAKLDAQPVQHFPYVKPATLKKLERSWWQLDLNSELSGDKVKNACKQFYAEHGLV